jgi:hypothetical protein
VFRITDLAWRGRTSHDFSNQEEFTMSTAQQPAPQGPITPPNKSAREAAQSGSRAEVAIVTLLIIVVIALSGLYVTRATNSYLLVLGTFVVFCMFLGRWICGRPLGIFIGERNLMSLSRLQMVLWTILILSAYLAMSLQRVHHGIPDPLAIGMDWHLWALMGISTASLVGSPLLLGNKTQKQADPEVVKRAAAQLKENEVEIKQNSAGTLYVNNSINDASFADIFQGDEIGNTAYIDVAKVQMFFFTLVSLLVYGTALFQMFKGTNYSAMPNLSDGLIALLGISHSGYLMSKTADHTPTA